MDAELARLYGSKNINIGNIINSNSNENNIKYFIKKSVIKSESFDGTNKEDKIRNTIEPIDVTNVMAQEIENNIINKTMFNTQKEALTYIEYLEHLERVISAAVKVNLADNNGDGFFPDYSNEDERKYIVTYNERTGHVSYDFTYTILADMTDYRLCFKNQTVTENFIRTFEQDLLYISNYKIKDLKKKL